MKNRILLFSAAALALVFAVALLVLNHAPLETAIGLILTVVPIFGALVTYQYPVSGTTPPTLAQMQVPGGIATMVTCQISMADADTLVVITHNMALTQTEQNNLFPLISSVINTAETLNPFLTFNPPTPSATPANTINVGKAAGGGSGFTATVWILRPHSLIK